MSSVRVVAFAEEEDSMFDRIYFDAVPGDLAAQIVERANESGTELAVGPPSSEASLE